jgi:hypothetical protein
MLDKMKNALFLIGLMLSTCTAVDLTDVFADKYKTKVDYISVVDVSPTTKAVRIDWQKDWWGTFNVIELNNDGSPKYWYDIEKLPTANCIYDIKVIDLNKEKYLQVIDITHMGNGFLYLYQIKDGFCHLKIEARAIANLDVKFKNKTASIEYRDINKDGSTDVVLSADILNLEDGKEIGKYYREFINNGLDFPEEVSSRKGNDRLFDK